MILAQRWMFGIIKKILEGDRKQFLQLIKTVIINVCNVNKYKSSKCHTGSKFTLSLQRQHKTSQDNMTKLCNPTFRDKKPQKVLRLEEFMLY